MTVKQDMHQMEPTMGHSVSRQIATSTFLELTDYLREYGDERDPSDDD
jgi:hypothetical protein